MEVRIGDCAVRNLNLKLGYKGPKSLRHLVAEDEVVAKRGKPSLPRLKFMEGLGPDDPKYT